MDGEILKAVKGRNVVAGLAQLMSTAAGTTHRAGKTYFNKALPAYVAGGGPGGWASNHFAESQQVKGWTFCAVRAIARTVARAKPEVHRIGNAARRTWGVAKKEYRRGRITKSQFEAVRKAMTASQDGDDSVPVGGNHPLLKLLKRPNPWMSRAQFLFQCAQQLSVTGTALLWVRRNNYRTRDGKGIPKRLYVVPTGLAVPLVPSMEEPAGAYRVMPVGSYGGVQFDRDQYGDSSWSSLMLTGGVIDGRQMKPVRWPHPLFLTDGHSPVTAGELWIDMAHQLDRATWYGFKNSLRPGMILGMAPDAEEPTADEAERFEAELHAKIAGIENAGKILRMPKGIVMIDKDGGVHELDYVNGRESAGRTVLALFSTPPVATGIQEAGAYAAYIASLIQFTEQAVTPILDLLADDMTHELCPAYGDELEIRLPAPPVNDSQQKLSEWQLLTSNRAVTSNELRTAFSLPPLDGRRGEFQVGTDWAVAGVEDFDLETFGAAQKTGSDGSPLDRTGERGNNGSKQSADGDLPPRPTDSGVTGKSLRHPRKRKLPDVPGFFRPAAAYVPSGLLNGKH